MEDLKERVTCPECQQLYQSHNSRLLPCLHTFCAECLRKIPVSVQVSSKAATPLAQDESKVLCTPEDAQPGNVQQRSRGSSAADSASDKTNTRSRGSSSTSSSEGTVCQYIECPKCKKQCLLPEKGVDGFQTSLVISDLVSLYVSLENYGRESGPRCLHCKDSPVAVAYCDKCRYFLCETCHEMHKRWRREYESHQVIRLEDIKESVEEAASSGGLDLIQKLMKTNEDSTTVPSFLRRPLKLQDVPCYHHSGEKIKFYCPKCRELLCHDCCIVTHQKHPTVTITNNVLEDHKSEMNSIATVLGDTAQQLDTLDKKTKEEKESFTKHVDEVRELIGNTFDELEQRLKTRKEALSSQLNELERDPLQKLEARELEIGRIRQQVTESKVYIEENLSHSGPTAMLSVERTMVDNNSTLCTEFGKIPSLEKSPQFCFFSDDQLLDLISSFGDVRAVLPEDTVSVGDRYSDTCGQADSLRADQLSLRGLSTSVYQTSELDRSSESASSSNIDSINSQVSINTASITVSVPRVQGDAIRTMDGFHHPSGVISVHFLIFCEYDDGTDHNVTIMTHQGMLIRRIGEKGEEDGRLFYPQSVAVDSSEQLFVTDANYRVQVFDFSGNCLKSVGSKGTGELQFKDPVGIAIGTNRHVFVCEHENNRIQVLGSDLSHYKFIGQKGKGRCEFNKPSDIAIDSRGLLYVVDSWNHRVQVLTQEGSFVRAIGSKGKNSGQLLSPSHICVDPDGFIYVSETRNHRISMFTIHGKFVKCFGEQGSGLGQMISPRGIAIDLNKLLYVCDYGNDRIQVFK